MDLDSFEVYIKNHSLVSPLYHYILQHFFNFLLNSNDFLLFNIHCCTVGIVNIDIEQWLQFRMFTIKVRTINRANDFVSLALVASFDILGSERIECE
jgi:hypothetical protein